MDADSQVPFIDLPNTHISIQWNALFNGRIVSEIYLTNPKLIFVAEDQGKERSNDAEYEAWTKARSDLVPIDINLLEISNGTAAFVELTADPTIDLHLKQVNLSATNSYNVELKERDLPSTVTL